jgi:uncharacterized MAPEG superfamily protein
VTVELLAVLAIAILQLFLAFFSASGLTMAMGMDWAAGNRETPSTASGWVARAINAHRNLIENSLPFTAAVLVAHATGVSTHTTVLAALTFVGARIAHAILYTVGITALRLRTIAHFIAIGSTLTIIGSVISRFM